MPTLMTEDGAELFVRVVIDERRVDEDERLLVGAERARIQMGAVDDVDLGRLNPELFRTLPRDPLNPRELAVGDPNGATEQLALPDLLPHPHRTGDSQLDRPGRLHCRTGLAIEDER